MRRNRIMQLMPVHTILIAYVAINLLSFALMGEDKRRYRRSQWRIPERLLLTVCVLGGALGGWLGMEVFRHKLRKLKFTLTVPLLMLVHMALLIFVMQ
jgi:uncharacterized membrane protein YsdA (DUF1294 family)